MIPRDDARNALEYDDYYAVVPAFQDWDAAAYRKNNGGTWCEDGFVYSSDTNEQWLTAKELRAMIGLDEAQYVSVNGKSAEIQAVG
jgi:UDP-N-acetylglucosamine 4,6-dehydratase